MLLEGKEASRDEGHPSSLFSELSQEAGRHLFIHDLVIHLLVCLFTPFSHIHPIYQVPTQVGDGPPVARGPSCALWRSLRASGRRKKTET